MEYEEIKGDGSIEWDFRLYASIRNAMGKIDYERRLDSRCCEEKRRTSENFRSEEGRENTFEAIKEG